MSEREKHVLAILGLVLALEGYVLNEISMIIFRETISRFIDIPGTFPHSGPLVIGTFWLFLIPVGFILFFLSIVFEIKDRYCMKDCSEIGNQT